MGFSYQYYSIKGLELQETSCHTVEASKVDGILSRAFDYSPYQNTQTGNTSLINVNFLHTLTPITKIPFLAYSDTKNVLTGVIDSSEFLSVVSDYFTKSLLYVLLDFVVLKRKHRDVKVTDDAGQPTTPPPNKKQIRPTSIRSSHHNIVSVSRNKLATLPNLLRGNDAPERNSTSANDDQQSARTEQSREAPSGDAQDTRSVQSGRGSRLAWVDKTRLNNKMARSNSIEWEQDTFATQATPKSASTVSGPKQIIQKRLSRQNLHSSTSQDFPPNVGKTQNFLSSPRILSSVNSRANIWKNSPSKDLPGFMSDTSDEEEKVDFESDNSDELEANTKGSAHQTLVTKVNLRVLSRTELTAYKDSSPFINKLTPPIQWLQDLPFDGDVIDSLQVFFPISWYKFLISHIVRQHLRSETAAADRNKSTQSLSADTKDQKTNKTKPPSAAEQKYGSEVRDNPASHPSNREHLALITLALEDESIEELYR